MADLGLTSARWEVLGAIAHAGTPQTVLNIACNMGLSRQSVQCVVNGLEADEFVSFTANPHHQQAKLAVLSKHGASAFQASTKLRTTWFNQLANGVASKGHQDSPQLRV